MRIHRWDVSRDGPLTEERMRHWLETRGYEVVRYDYPPGTVFGDHRHDVEKIDAVLSGRFRIDMEGGSVVLERGDALEVPRGVVHRAEVVGNETVVSLDAVRRR
jgi:quercetin dioxygenase-like cupin family protein